MTWLRRDESGSTMLLTILFAVVTIALVLVVASTASLYIERKRLYSLADATALVAAEQWQDASTAVVNDHLEFHLDPPAMRSAAAEYLARAATRLRAPQLVAVQTRDGQTAEVTLRSVWRAPFGLDFLPLAVPIEVTTTARAVVH
ncbi:MAG TPA: pilus assembly protein TadG-related protein [Candidatus Lumbricidophila sp.]|nr:pilus assembly protein TadG-related protein [Candidatus Lumbricidophila sp.]